MLNGSAIDAAISVEFALVSVTLCTVCSRQSCCTGKQKWQMSSVGGKYHSGETQCVITACDCVFSGKEEEIPEK